MQYTQKCRFLQILRYVGPPHTCCTDKFIDMLDIDALVQKRPIFDMCCVVVSIIMLRDKKRSARARVRMRELRAKGSSRRKTWHTKAGVGDKRSVAQS